MIIILLLLDAEENEITISVKANGELTPKFIPDLFLALVTQIVFNNTYAESPP